MFLEYQNQRNFDSGSYFLQENSFKIYFFILIQCNLPYSIVLCAQLFYYSRLSLEDPYFYFLKLSCIKKTYSMKMD